MDTKELSILVNGQIRPSSEFNPDTDTSADYIYEVIRIINGKPLFPQEHYDRLRKSLEAIGHKATFSNEDMCDYIAKLVQANGIENDNVKLIIDNFSESKEYDIYLFILGAKYPSPNAYANGVDTELFVATRDNPHIKVRNQSLRDATNQIIADHSLFEVILVDDQGNITEGSRSNMFFIKDGVVLTSPAGDVLLGVTRQKIIQLCREDGIEVREEIIPANQVNTLDAAFVSGTSPKVLPIRRIDDTKLNVHDSTLRRIMELFDNEIAKLY